MKFLGELSDPIRRCRPIASLLLTAGLVLPCASLPRQAPPATKRAKLAADQLDDRITVRVDEKTFAVYRFGRGQKYPYLFPVNGPLSGQPLTTESSLPYPHHRSLFFGCDRVNGGNYWQEGNELGQIISAGPKIVTNGPDTVEIADECDWKQPGKEPIMRDVRRIRVEAPAPELRTIDFSVELRALLPIRIEKTNHSLFSARVRPELSVPSGGRLINAEGEAGEKATLGKKSPWMDFSGQICGVTEGIAIFDSPGNPWFPSPWFTRDYGFFSPTPLYWIEADGYRIEPGKPLQLRYRVVVHGGNAESARIADLFAAWSRVR